ncbi:unnamed protein product [[Actinomadura] parvosata subsp. kistnae]|nr:unnamed protein product [Actinomadura parvosata subsp. kistnae]
MAQDAQAVEQPAASQRRWGRWRRLGANSHGCVSFGGSHGSFSGFVRAAAGSSGFVRAAAGSSGFVRAAAGSSGFV